MGRTSESTNKPKKYYVVQVDAEGNEMGYVKPIYGATLKDRKLALIQAFDLENYIRKFNSDVRTMDDVLKKIEIDKDTFNPGRFFVCVFAEDDETQESDLFFLMDLAVVPKANNKKKRA